jgi:hypothetical protein
MSSLYIDKVQSEIDRLLENGKLYWYDFNLNHEQMNAIVNYFSELYDVEAVMCKSCGANNKKYDITITLG